MPNEHPARPKDGCPHCGKKVQLSLWTLLPSSDRRRVLKCQACGGRFDLSDNSKMAGMLGGMVGMGLAVMFPFGWILRAGHGSKLYLVAATAVVALGFGLTSMLVARLTMRLVPKA